MERFGYGRHTPAIGGLHQATGARETSVPIGFGVLTVESIEQAVERAGTKMGNKGAEAALATLEMATLLRAIDQRVL